MYKDMRQIAEKILISTIAIAVGFFACYGFFYTTGIIVSSEFFYNLSIDLRQHIGLLVIVEILLSLAISLILVLLIIFLINKAVSINTILFKVIYAMVIVFVFFLGTMKNHQWLGLDLEDLLMSLYYNSVYIGLLIGLPILFLGSIIPSIRPINGMDTP